MRNSELIRYVRSLDERDPDTLRRLRRRTIFWIALGYAFFVVPMTLGVVASSILLVASIINVHTWTPIPILIACGLLAASFLPMIPLMRSLRDGDDGYSIDPRRHPTFADQLSGLATQLSVRIPHTVCLTPDFNAGVRMRARRNWLGMRRRELAIGVPLLENLDPQEMRSVLAHELAHLSSGDERSSMAIYRIRSEWELRANQWAQPSANSAVRMFRMAASAVFRWWWPRLNRDAFLLARACERFADRASARCTTPAIARKTLCRIASIAVMLEQREQFARNRELLDNDAFGTSFFGMIGRLIEVSYQDEDRQHWMEAARRRCDWPLQTHPSLRERWINLDGMENDLSRVAYPSPPTTPAAEAWFGTHWPQLREACFAHMADETIQQWTSEQRRLHQQRREVDRGLAVGDSSSLINAAWIQRELSGPQAALEILRTVESSSNAVAVNLCMGQCYCDLTDARCEIMLHPILAGNDAQSAIAAGEALANYYWKIGDEAEMLRATQRCDAIDRTAFQTGKESSGDFDFPSLDESERAALVSWIKGFDGVGSAYLARRVGKEQGEVVQHVLCVQSVKRSWFSREPNQRLQQAMLRDRHKPARIIVCTPGGSYSRLAKRLRKQEQFRLRV